MMIISKMVIYKYEFLSYVLNRSSVTYCLLLADISKIYSLQEMGNGRF